MTAKATTTRSACSAGQPAFATCGEDVAAYLLDHGATLNVWTAIALDRGDELRAMIGRDLRCCRPNDPQPASPHAAPSCRGEKSAADRAPAARARRRPERDRCDRRHRVDDGVAGERRPEHRRSLLDAGAKLDFLTAVNLGRYGEAEAMLREIPRASVPTAATPSRCTWRSARRTRQPFAGCSRMASTSTPSGRCGTAITPRST